jgi:hypothetical protein
VERGRKRCLRGTELDQSPYLLAENKRGLAFPGAKGHRQLLSLLNKRSPEKHKKITLGERECREKQNPDYVEGILI